MSTPKHELLATLLAGLAMVAPERPENTFLLNAGWVPLGASYATRIQGWGKLIDGKAVMVDEPEALQMAGWPGDGQ